MFNCEKVKRKSHFSVQKSRMLSSLSTENLLQNQQDKQNHINSERRTVQLE